MQNKPYEGSVSDRLERLPFSSVQRDFLLMVAGGEWAETLMLLGNGAVLALAGHALGLTGLAPVMIATAFFLGEFVGSAFFGWLADRKGRKFVFLYNLLVFSFGMLMAGFMSLPYLIAIFVFIGGIGVGGEFPLVDSFTTEMMPAKVRGNRLALVYTIAVTAGFVIAFLAYEMGIIVPLYYSWRILFWFMAVVGFGVWAVRTRLKESPRWLEVHGEYKKADEITTDWEQRTMKAKHLSELPKPTTNTPIEENRSRYRDMFEPDVRKRSIMMIIFQFFQSGIFYGFTALAPFFLIKKGFNLPTTLGFVFLIFTGFFFGSVFNLFIIDKVERKWGIIGSAVLAGIFGTAFAVATNVYLVVIFGFITTFILWNFSNFFHAYQAEIFPTRIRPTAAGTVYAVSRVSTAILIIFIADIFLPHGVVASFGIIWVFIAIVVLDLWILGPKSSREQVETIAQ